MFDEAGRLVPVTVVEVGPCHVVQKKDVETDGYQAIQVGSRREEGQGGQQAARRSLRQGGRRAAPTLERAEGRGLPEFQALEVGAELRADLFGAGDYVDVTGTSKGKGFAGVIKRWNFHRGPMEHGSMYHRRVGSLGAADPARVFKGRKLPGRMGGVRRTVQGLRVVKVDAERNLLLIEGSVPGIKGSLVEIRETVKNKGK